MLLVSQTRVASAFTVPSLADPTGTMNGSERFFQEGREKFEREIKKLLQRQQNTEREASLLLIYPDAVEPPEVNECTEIDGDSCVIKN